MADHTPRAPKRRRRRKANAPRSKGLGPLAWTGIVIVGVLAAVVAGVAVLLTAMSPAQLVQDQLTAQVKRATGRNLVIAGGSGLTFWPNIAVSLRDVRLSAPPGMDAPDTLRANRIAVRVKLMPLLSGRAEVDEVKIVEPDIDLRINRDGRVSWDFGALQTRDRKSARILFAQAIGNGGGAATNDAASPRGGRAASADANRNVTPGLVSMAEYREIAGVLQRVNPSDVEIERGRLTFTDMRSGTTEQLTDVDLRFSPEPAQGAAAPVNYAIAIDGRLKARGRLINMKATVGTLETLLLEGRGSARIDVSTGKTAMTVTARPQNLGSDPSATFQVTLDAPSADALARLGNVGLPKTRQLGAVDLDITDGTATPTAITAGGLRLALGQSEVQGRLQVALLGPRPEITGALQSKTTIDVDALSAAFTQVRQLKTNVETQSGASSRSNDARGTSSQGTGKGDTGNGDAGNPKSIDDLLRRSVSPQVKGDTRRNGWSTQRVDISALGAVDADVALTLAGVRVSGMTVGNTKSRVRLKDGGLRTDITQMALYEGAGKGRITVGPRGKQIAIGARFDLTDVHILPLMRDMAQFDTIDGRGNVSIQLSTTGQHEFAWVSGLNGNGKIAFRDGALVGWNIAKILRNASRLQFSDLEKSPAEKTDFSALTASFKIRKGIARTDDVNLVSPLLGVKGSGDIRLPNRQLDMKLQPTLVASLQGQGRGNTSGLTVPVRVKGPWGAPDVNLDMDALAKDPEQLNKTINQVGRQLGAGDVLDNLTKPGGAKKLLDGFLGR